MDRPGFAGRFMRFTSLIVELIRARPRLVVWIVVLGQAALWFLVSLLFYRSPPGDLATVLAFGREYQVGTELGPPLVPLFLCFSPEAPRAPSQGCGLSAGNPGWEPTPARRSRSGSPISPFAPPAITCSAFICSLNSARSRRSGRSICWRGPS